MTVTHRRIIQSEFISLPLNDPQNLHDYSRVTDNHLRDGKLFLGGGYGTPEVWEAPSNLVWVRELCEGTAPDDHSYTGGWELLTVAQFKGKYAQMPQLKAGDRVALKHFPYITGVVACQSEQAKYLRGEEKWFVKWNDGFDMFARSHEPESLIKWSGKIILEVRNEATALDRDGAIYTEAMSILRDRIANPVEDVNPTLELKANLGKARQGGYKILHRIVDGNLIMTVVTD